ncbi:hypothetical protein [Sphingobacterium detergens]|uniref:hypothetical protein n=1 Tax=Sphingobacterium detergens TaxID=1145106 RepID=UPI003AACDF81
MKKSYPWLIKKTPRSIDQLRLWPQNPRLNPNENHIHLSDFAEDLTSDDAEKNHLFDLVKSIVEDTFIPADPIVVWKDLNGKFYVAEGNRRILALKLLREPNKAPRNIRAFINSQSQRINKQDIEKVYVNVAPTFEDAEWYINQRNSTSSLQRAWSRIQQQRWISELYEKYKDDLDKIVSITKMTKGELENFIRTLKIQELVKDPIVKESLNDTEYSTASSHKFPITILERFFSNKEVKEKWGLDFDGPNISFKNRRGFLNAYSILLKNIISEDENRIKIDTRTITTDLDSILERLPTVDLTIQNEEEKPESPVLEDNNLTETNEGDKVDNAPIEYQKDDPNRGKLILPIYHLKTDSKKLSELFEELKKIPFSYKNSMAASIRIFLDLAVLNFIDKQDLRGVIAGAYKCNFIDVNLKNRLEYLKQNTLADHHKKIVSRLIEAKNDFSLDVLNGYVHSQQTHYLRKDFLNGFWDFLFPLFQALLDIREDKK